MEELEKGEFVSWETKGKLSFLLKIGDTIRKYTLIPKDKNFLIVWARNKDEWSSIEYFKEKLNLKSSRKGKFSLFRDLKRYLLKLEDEAFILPRGLPKENPLIAIKSEKPLKFKKFKQMKISDHFG
ncbi:MAG: hypothetical protein ACTSO9_14215 [Candidatus Helarchaeota archaeon]